MPGMHSNPFSAIDLRDEALALHGTSRERAAELLRAADDPHALALDYQPIVDLGRGEVVGVEALVRWHHPEHGLLLPDSFLPLAEHIGAIIPLGLWVLETACRQGARWASQGLQLEVAVNLSARQLTDPSLVDDVRRILAKTELHPSQLLLEITETSLTDEVGAGKALEDLAGLGVQLGLDDFGTGHSSLLYLKRYPITALKIDSTFVAGLGSNRDDEAIVASVASLATAVGSRCIAEGVQTTEQYAQLLPLRCQAQGRLFAPPVSAAELPAAVDGAEAVLDSAQPTSRRTRKRKAAPELRADVAQRILHMHHDGASLQTIAAALNQGGLLHPKGTRWHASSVAGYLSDAVARGRMTSSR